MLGINMVLFIYYLIFVLCLVIHKTHNLQLGEEETDDELDIVAVDNSTYKASCHVAKFYYKSIIGKDGSTKHRIENDTNTLINIPKQWQEANITILGPTEKNVKEAMRMINDIVVSIRMKQKPSHFISIPMNNHHIKMMYEEFKTAVLRECSRSRNIDAALFGKPVKLHLTIGVMSLKDEEEVLFASKLLVKAKAKVIVPLLEGHLPLNIRLKGLSYMDNDPSHINVLYGIVQENSGTKGLIQKLADGLVDYFNKAGYMKREYDHVTLHVTFMNTNYLKHSRVNRTEPDTSNDSRNKLSFDGRDVLKKFGDYDFGVMDLTYIYLSEMRTGAGGYYKTCAVVSVTN